MKDLEIDQFKISDKNKIFGKSFNFFGIKI